MRPPRMRLREPIAEESVHAARPGCFREHVNGSRIRGRVRPDLLRTVQIVGIRVLQHVEDRLVEDEMPRIAGNVASVR